MLEMFQYSFMVRALLAGSLVAATAPVVGLFLVLRRLSLVGDTLAHVALTGVAAGMLARVYPLATALGFTVAAAVGMEQLRAAFRRYGELAVAVVLSTAVGTAAVLLSLGGSTGVDLFGYLFGSLMTVTWLDVQMVAALAAVTLLVVALLYKELFFLTFDDELAVASGLPARAINLVFTVLVAVVVTLAMRVVGVLLISSLTILPVAAAMQLARSFRGALLGAVAFAQGALWVGMTLAYWFSLPPGGTVVLTGVGLLGLAMGLRRWLRRGLDRPEATVGQEAGEQATGARAAG